MNPIPPASSCPSKTQCVGAPDSSVVVTQAGIEQLEWFDAQLRDHHYLGAGRPVGDYLRQIVTVRGRPAALLVWGPACYALKDRDEWIGWDATTRVERLKLVVQNRRFLLLCQKGAAPNLASQTMAAALRVLPEQWQERFGYRPLLAESFTDPEAYSGTCYKASNWEPVGFSAGFSRHRADFYVPNDRPKRLWLYPLDAKARARLCAAEPPPDCRAGVRPAPTGTLPLKRPQIESLLEVFRRAPDPRGKSVQYRIAAVLTIVAMALLCGRREFSQFARFATSLSQPQRRLLGLPRKKDRKAFWQVPSYSVFYDVLTHLDADAFASRLEGWLQAHAGQLPAALALDGKMIRDHLGVLSLVDHDDGAPQTLALYDQKEGTARCEQTAATALLSSLPALDGKTVTADALHCQRATAHAVVGLGGEYCLQIKGNQPKLLAHARALDALPDTPFLPRRPKATVDSNSAACTPSPSRPKPSTSPSPAA